MNELGDFLRKLRGRMTYREASELSGVSHAYIRYLEIGKRPGTNTPINPSPEMLRGLAKAYNHPYKDLMMRAGYSYDETEKEQTNTEEVDTVLGIAGLGDLIKKYSDEEITTMLQHTVKGESISDDKVRKILSYVRFVLESDL